jgi:hypothetical protein
MKNNFSKYTLLISTIFISCLSGCLKDKAYDDYSIQSVRTNGGVGVAEISLTTTSSVNFQLLNLEASSSDTIINLIPVSINKPSSSDVKITLVSSPTVIADYNSNNGTSYALPPASVYTISSLVVTVPAGSTTGYLKVKFKPTDFLAGGSAFAFQIAAVDQGYLISSNLNKGMVAIGVKNKFDGVYTLKSKQLDWQNNSPGNIANTPWTWPGDIFMITSGPASVNMFDNWGFLTYIHPIQTTTPGWSGFGSTNPKFIFDPATNKMTDCVNDYATPPPNGRAFKMNPAITTSRWDPVTKNIYAAIILSQPGRTDLQIFDTLLYTGPR